MVAVPELCWRLSDALGACVTQDGAGVGETQKGQHDCCQQVEELLCAVLLRLDPPSTGYEEATAQAAEKQPSEAPEVAAELLRADVLRKLPGCLEAIDFEARKDAMRIFDEVLRLGVMSDSTDGIAVEYVRKHPEIIRVLLAGAAKTDALLHSSHMLQSCTRTPALAAIALEAGAVMRVIDLALHQNLDVSLEAFAVLRKLILAHREVSAPYVLEHFDEYFEAYHALLQVEHYVIQRQALRLLGETLLDSNFTEVMLAYVDSGRFLQIHMNLLRNESKAIRMEAFHVFKIFVANPNQVPPISRILFRNRDRLVDRLERNFRQKGGSDECFSQDLHVVVEKLQGLELR